MKPFEVYMHFDLYGAIPKSGAQRREILDFLHSLSTRPNMPGDYTEKDASLREYQVKVIGKYAVMY